MLEIPCPWCGKRNELEFHYRDEANILRPDTNKSSDQDWSGYMYERDNTRGWQVDLWSHDAGCGRYFFLVRNSLDDRIIGSYKIGDKPITLPKKKKGR